MNKFIKDGKVAVLVSPRFGAGWYTWNMGRPECLFDPDVVKMVLEGRHKTDLYVEQFVEAKYGDEFYSGGLRDLEVRWVEQGRRFYVMEYDGSESLLVEDMMMTA
jgi:hypothetical protein